MPATPTGATLPALRRRLPAALIPSLTTWALCLLFLGPFLMYPVGRVVHGALTTDGVFTPSLLLIPFNEFHRKGIINSFYIGVGTMVLASLIALPLAYAAARLRFPGKSLLTGLLLVPMLLPPLVGAVGLKQILSMEGIVNTVLKSMHLIKEPIPFLRLEAMMVVIVAALHLYPLIYLNVSAAWANIDSSLEEAAENQGAGSWHVLRTVTLPLLRPGYLSGALIVFIFAFTDLGTPLVFNFKDVAAVQIFDNANKTGDPVGYVLAFWLTVLACAIFWVSRRFLDGGRIATLARGTRRSGESEATRWQLVFIYAYFGLVISLALLPHVGVLMMSFAYDWTSRLLPQWTLENYSKLFNDPTIEAASGIKLSLLCAALSMSIDVIAGFALAYALVRGKVWGKGFLDTLAMLPLALPGLILAFGLLVSYIDTPLDPFENAIPLLVIAYAVRRLPYAVRAVSSGLQQMSIALEEASLNLGASPVRTAWNITRPLVMPNLIAAALLTFAFAVLEVSDSLILGVIKGNQPIAQVIYQLTLRGAQGVFQACALGVIGMLLLTATFLLVNRLLGKQLGSLFRI